MKKKGKAVLDEFKAFIMRGNVIDMAVGVIIGGAFSKIVTSLVNDVIMPLLSLLVGKMNFSELKIVIAPATESTPESAFRYGAFIQAVIDFLIIALCIFIMIKVVTVIRKRLEEKIEKEEKKKSIPPKPSKEEILLTEIRDLLKELKKGEEK